MTPEATPSQWISAAGEPALPAAPPPQPEEVPEPAPPAAPPPSRLWLWFFLAVGAYIGYSLYQAQQYSLETAPAPDRGVRTAVAARQTLRQTFRVGGSIAAESFAAIRAPELRLGRSGRGGGSQMTLIQMAAPGSRANAGDVVAEFDRQRQQETIDDQKASLAVAEANIQMKRANLMTAMETARQRLRTAKAEYEKAQLDLRTAEVRSAIEGEIFRLAVREAEANYRQLEKEVELLEISQSADLRDTELSRDQEKIDLARAERNAQTMLLRTPVSGIVVMMTTFRGGTFAQVSAGDEVYPGSYFMQVVDPSKMILQAQLNQADSQKLRPGQRAEIRLDAYPDAAFPGRVAVVGAMTGSGGSGRFRAGSGDYVRTIEVRIIIEQADRRIIPDLSAGADVLLAEAENALVVPREALRHDSGGAFVYVRQNPKSGFVRRPVETGLVTDTHVEIAAGLEEGEEVALGEMNLARM